MPLRCLLPRLDTAPLCNPQSNTRGVKAFTNKSSALQTHGLNGAVYLSRRSTAVSPLSPRSCSMSSSSSSSPATHTTHTHTHIHHTHDAAIRIVHPHSTTRAQHTHNTRMRYSATHARRTHTRSKHTHKHAHPHTMRTICTQLTQGTYTKYRRISVRAYSKIKRGRLSTHTKRFNRIKAHTGFLRA